MIHNHSLKTLQTKNTDPINKVVFTKRLCPSVDCLFSCTSVCLSCLSVLTLAVITMAEIKRGTHGRTAPRLAPPDFKSFLKSTVEKPQKCNLVVSSMLLGSNLCMPYWLINGCAMTGVQCSLIQLHFMVHTRFLVEIRYMISIKEYFVLSGRLIVVPRDRKKSHYHL